MYIIIAYNVNAYISYYLHRQSSFQSFIQNLANLNLELVKFDHHKIPIASKNYSHSIRGRRIPVTVLPRQSIEYIWRNGERLDLTKPIPNSVAEGCLVIFYR